MNDDSELLRRFADEGSQEAFAELVRRTVNFVYAAALRQTNGDAHLAQDVTQGVFFALASQAATLKRHAALAGWLHTTTRFVAIRTLRTQVRWQRREQEANSMNTLLREPDPAWETLRPVIDEALHDLGDKDRTALLLRFFEGRSLAEVGTAIGLNENSARMRVERALEKLRERLAQRGVTSTAVALGLILTNQPVVAAPAGFAATITGPVLAGAAAGGGSLTPLAGWVTLTKIAGVALGAAAVLGTGAYLGVRSRDSAQNIDLSALRAENERLTATLRQLEPAGNDAEPTGGNSPAGQRLNELSDDAVQKRAKQKAAVVAVVPGLPGANAAGAVNPGSLAAVQLLADLKARKVANTGITFVGNDGKLSPAFGELFALTSGEQTALQQSVNRAREQLAELERDNSIVTRNEKGDVTIAVNSFAEAGGRTYDELMKAFAATLGSERNTAFLTLGAAQVEQALGDFGAAERTITLAFNPQSTARPFAVSKQRKLPGESGSTAGSFGTLKEALDWAGTLGRLVPAEFGR